MRPLPVAASHSASVCPAIRGHCMFCLNQITSGDIELLDRFCRGDLRASRFVSGQWREGPQGLAFLRSDGSRGRTHVGCRHEPGALCRRDEGPPRGADGRHAGHGCLYLPEGAIAGMVGDRPFLPQPISGLLGGGDVLDVTRRRHDKGKGLAPVDFDQRQFFRKRRIPARRNAAGSRGRRARPQGAARPSGCGSLSLRQERGSSRTRVRCGRVPDRTKRPGRRSTGECRPVQARTHGRKCPLSRFRAG